MATSMHHIRLETIENAYNLSRDIGIEAACKELEINKDTLTRYRREYLRRTVDDRPETEDFGNSDTALTRQLLDKFTRQELRAIINGSATRTQHGKHVHKFKGDQITIGVLSDTHLGSVYTDPNYIQQAFDMFDCADVDMITISGDIFEGLSNRPGHMYECSHVGYSAQLQHGRELFGQWTQTPIYMVDGNHDRWYRKSNGALIVEELCRDSENLVFLGNDEGDIDLGHVCVKLWHGEDGSSYAFSYRIQKIVESFTGGTKPNVLICGHTHKALYVFDRHIHCVSAGSIQRQSKWMRGKRAAAHTGFWIVRMDINDCGVGTFSPTWYPFYA